MPRTRWLAALLALVVVALGPGAARADGPSANQSLADVLVGEGAAPAQTTMVLFGATGDLAGRMVIPSLFALHQKGELPAGFRLIGASNDIGGTQAFRSQLRQRVRDVAGIDVRSAAWKRFEGMITTQRVDFAKPASLQPLEKALAGDRQPFFYLALPPAAFEPAIDALAARKLIGKKGRGAKARLVFEKPFGRNLAESRRLSKKVQAVTDESRVMRMDHYLGKQAVLEMVGLRFHNRALEPAWNSRYIDKVVVSARETLDVANRGSFYDQTGAMRDFIQGHLMQVLSLATMDEPKSASRVRSSKARVLAKARVVDAKRGQYAGYRATQGVKKGSTTETYAALTATIDSPRWRGTQFVLESGKALSEKRSEVVVDFRRLPAQVAKSLGVRADAPATLTVTIDPKPEISLTSGGKTVRLESGLAIANREPYERLLLAGMAGRDGLFAGGREVERAWTIIKPVERQWARSKKMSTYRRGVPRPRVSQSLFPRRPSSIARHLRRAQAPKSRRPARARQTARARPVRKKSVSKRARTRARALRR